MVYDVYATLLFKATYGTLVISGMFTHCKSDQVKHYSDIAVLGTHFTGLLSHNGPVRVNTRHVTAILLY